MTERAMRSMWGVGVLALLSGCAVSARSGEPGATPAPAKATSAPAAGAKQAAAEPVAPPAPKLLHTLEAKGFAAPEAVLYDADNDFYLVSNVNGAPLAADANGFISKVSPEGEILELKWIDGQKPGTTLNAPKGMAISGPYLYVSDITWIRIFDRKTGASKGKVHTQATSFLNDVATAPNGDIYFSDTGWKNGKDGFQSTGTDGVFRIDPKSVAAKEVMRDKALGNPNGIAATQEGLWVVNDQGELYRVTDEGKREQTTKLAKGGLDGVVALEDGSFLVSSWEGGAIYHGKPGGEFSVFVEDLKSPASIGYDTKRDRVLVPKMMEDRVLVYSMPGAANETAEASASTGSAPAPGAPVLAPAPAAPKAKPKAESEQKSQAVSVADAKKPAAKKPAAKKPMAQKAKPASKNTLKKPAVKKAKPASKPAMKKPAAKKAKPAMKKPAVKKAKPAPKNMLKKPAAKPAAKKAAPKKAKPASKPALKKPAAKKAKPAAKPAMGKPAVKKPAANKAKPAAKPALKKPAAKKAKPAAKPALKKPAAKKAKPAAKKPAVKTKVSAKGGKSKAPPAAPAKK